MLRYILAVAGTKKRTFGAESIQRFEKTISNWILRYIQAWREPKALEGMLGYYRALFRYRESPKSERVTVPTLIIWGRKDVALEEGLANLSLEYCDNGKLVFFDDASHFVQHDQPENVYQEIASFISPKS